MPGRERVASACANVRPLPQANAAGDFPAPNAISQSADELHGRYDRGSLPRDGLPVAPAAHLGIALPQLVRVKARTVRIE